MHLQIVLVLVSMTDSYVKAKHEHDTQFQEEYNTVNSRVEWCIDYFNVVAMIDDCIRYLNNAKRVRLIMQIQNIAVY